MGMITQLFAVRLAEQGIRVFEVRPGIIETDMTAGVKEAYLKRIEAGLVPIKRIGSPDDVGKAVAHLATADLLYSTGDVLNVDGGFHLRRL
jgi:NAD(P)-dependent dehydrogenase (short-subunit alcohol dehydrogenase family)